MTYPTTEYPNRIPIYPPEGIFETTVAVVEGQDRLIGHEEVLDLLDYHPVTVADLQRRATENLKERGWVMNSDGIWVAPSERIPAKTPAKKAAAKKTSKKPAAKRS